MNNTEVEAAAERLRRNAAIDLMQNIPEYLDDPQLATVDLYRIKNAYLADHTPARDQLRREMVEKLNELIEYAKSKHSDSFKMFLGEAELIRDLLTEPT